MPVWINRDIPNPIRSWIFKTSGGNAHAPVLGHDDVYRRERQARRAVGCSLRALGVNCEEKPGKKWDLPKSDQNSTATFLHTKTPKALYL